MPISFSNWRDLTSEVLTNIFLFGNAEKPADLTDESLIRPSGDGEPVEVDMASFMSDGPGRFASPVMSTLVARFFTSVSSQLASDGKRHEYSIADIKTIIGGSQSFTYQ